MAGPAGASNLGSNLTGMAGLGAGQEEAGVDQAGRGLGRQDRLVLLGPLSAEEVLEDAVLERDPGPDDQPSRALGSNQASLPSDFQAGSGLNASVGLGGSSSGANQGELRRPGRISGIRGRHCWVASAMGGRPRSCAMRPRLTVNRFESKKAAEGTGPPAAGRDGKSDILQPVDRPWARGGIRGRPS